MTVMTAVTKVHVLIDEVVFRSQVLIIYNFLSTLISLTNINNAKYSAVTKIAVENVNLEVKYIF